MSTTGSSTAAATPAGGRLQLALNVRDLDAAVQFYSSLFDTQPAKRRPGYANFAIAAPPLKLVLIENPDARGDGVHGALNHLGIEVPGTKQVSAATQRLTGEGLDTLTQDATTCCYAVQDKVWVHDPDGAPWEVYTVLSQPPPRREVRRRSDAPAEIDHSSPVLTDNGVPRSAAAGACC